MARKIKFPLEMNGAEIRSLDELKEHFSISQVLTYLKNGKLDVWLRDRNLNEMADEIQILDLETTDWVKKLCMILNFSQEKSIRFNKLYLLKQHTAEPKYEKVIDNIAFTQNELEELLEDGAKEIYLCGEKFSIPLANTGIKYVGINKPTAVIDSKEIINWEDKEISIENMAFDEAYQKATGQTVPEKLNSIEPEYQPSLRFKSYLDDKTFAQCKANYELLRNEFLAFHIEEEVEDARCSMNSLCCKKILTEPLVLPRNIKSTSSNPFDAILKLFNI